MDIFLVRHGEAAASWGQAADPGLSELGLQQARQTSGELLEALSATATVQLVSSPLLRAQETAAPLAEALGGVTVHLDSAYAEIPSPVPLGQRQLWLREFMQQQWQGQPDELLTWRAEIMSSLLALQTPTVVFTHFLVLNAVVGLLQDHPETLCFWPDNAAVIRLRHTGDGLELLESGRQMSTVVN